MSLRQLGSHTVRSAIYYPIMFVNLMLLAALASARLDHRSMPAP